MRNDLKKDYSWNTLGVFAQNAISPLLLIVITRLNGIGDSGTFSYAFSIALIFFSFGVWGGRTFQVSDIKHEFSHHSYIMVRVILAIFMLGGAIIFSLINGYDIIKTSTIVMLVLFKVVESVADSIHGILQVHNRLFIVGKSLLYKAVCGFVGFVLVDVLTHNILLSCLAIVIANILLVIFYDIRIARNVEDLKIKTTQIKRHASSALVIIRRTSPVFAVSFLAVFSLNIPRYFIDRYESDQIGYFGIIAMPITLIVLLMSFVLQPNVVQLSWLYSQAKYLEFKKIVTRLVLVTLGVGVLILLAAFLLGVPVLHLVFGVSFANYKAALLLMIAGGIASALGTVFINVLIIMRHFKAQFYTLLFTNVVLALVSASVVKAHGLLGGVSLFAAANLLQIVLLVATYNSILRKASYAKEA